jgi:predicted nuclease of predicted toxin-antitoxin system
VKFLVDNQLPSALARHLAIVGGVDCLHVSDIGKGQSSDSEIWAYILESGRILITKDEDFFHRASSSNVAAQIVWVRLGNCRNEALLGAFDRLWERLVASLAARERVVEVR